MKISDQPARRVRDITIPPNLPERQQLALEKLRDLIRQADALLSRTKAEDS